MNDDDNPRSDLADLEARLRAWQPSELPPALRARLRAAGRRPLRPMPQTVPPRAGALAWVLTAAACLAWLATRFTAPSGPVDAPGSLPGGSPALSRAPEPERLAEARWTPGESLTMNLAMSVPPGAMPVAWSLDGGRAELSDLILVRSPDGNLPLKVDCQF